MAFKSPFNINWHTPEIEGVLMSIHDGKLSYQEAADLIGATKTAVGFHLGEFRRQRGIEASRITRKPGPKAKPKIEASEEDIEDAEAVRILLAAVREFAALMVQKKQKQVLSENAKLKSDNARLAQENRTLRESINSFEKQFAEQVLTQSVKVIHGD